MRRTVSKGLALAGLPALYVLHNDFWFWDDPRFVLGLPVGLGYHVAFCAVTSVVMALLVRHAWPEHLEVEPPSPERGPQE